MSFLTKHKEDIDFLFNMLQEHVKNKYEIEVNNIDTIKEKSRKAHLVYFRKMMMLILGEAFLKNYNQDDISSVVGLDRTSFIHHCKIHRNDYGFAKGYKEEYDQIRDAYFEKIGIN